MNRTGHDGRGEAVLQTQLLCQQTFSLSDSDSGDDSIDGTDEEDEDY